MANTWRNSDRTLFGGALKSLSLPGGSDGKVSAYNAGDPGSIPGSGRSGEENGWFSKTHSSTLAWKILWMDEPGRLHTVHGVTKSRTQLSNFIFLFFFTFLSLQMVTSAMKLKDSYLLLGRKL